MVSQACVSNMAGLVLVLGLLAALTDTGTAGVSRADVNDVRLNDLTEKLDGLISRVEGAKELRDQRGKTLTELQGRLEDLTDKKGGCGPREFRCGSIVKDCISDMLACDGKEDCSDGSDEKSCDNPAGAGRSFHGDTYNLKCFSDISPSHIALNVIGENRQPWFASVVETKVQLELEYNDGSSAEGVYEAAYYFGQRVLAIYPHSDEGIAITCKFRTSTSDSCHAEIRGLIGNKVCGEAILVAK